MREEQNHDAQDAAAGSGLLVCLPRNSDHSEPWQLVNPWLAQSAGGPWRLGLAVRLPGAVVQLPTSTATKMRAPLRSISKATLLGFLSITLRT